jgi:hypothetical protein
VRKERGELKEQEHDKEKKKRHMMKRRDEE